MRESIQNKLTIVDINGLRDAAGRISKDLTDGYYTGTLKEKMQKKVRRLTSVKDTAARVRAVYILNKKDADKIIDNAQYCANGIEIALEKGTKDSLLDLLGNMFGSRDALFLEDTIRSKRRYHYREEDTFTVLLDTVENEFIVFLNGEYGMFFIYAGAVSK